MRPLAIVVIGVVGVDMATFGFDEAFLAPDVAAPLHAIVVGVGRSPVAMGVSATMPVGSRCGGRIVAVLTRVDVPATPP
jgi:hypothetical protein